MKSVSCICLTALSLVLAGCTSNRSVNAPAVQFVQDILSDPGSRQYQSLAFFDQSSTKGDIVIVDDPRRAVSFSDAFIGCDFCDNISGAEGGDMLPDFAGERISAILDVANGDYASKYLEPEDTALRTISVKAFLSSMDTTCCIAPYDNDYSSSRNPAKCIVLSSPYMDVCGKYDIDMMLDIIRKDIPVIYPVRAAFEKAFEKTDGFFNLAVIPDEYVNSLQVYSDIFKDVAKQYDDHLSACIALRSDDSTDLFANTVALYASAGMGGRLNVLVIDNPSVDIEALRQSYETIMTVQSERNLELRKNLSSELLLLSTLDCAARRCYGIFREKNIFTHKIAYPKASAYITKDLPGQYVLMDYDPSFMPEGLEDKLKQSAPKSFALYVQN